MKILTTYLYPPQGTAEINGINVLEDPLKVRQLIGYLPETLPLYMDMEVKGYLEFVGTARGLRGNTLKGRIREAVDACGLAPMFRKPIRQLSKGYKQRTGLAQALIHDPEVIILDEPTSGLDPHQIMEIRDLIARLAENKTVILSTHILQEVEATADRIVIINHGRIVGNGTVDELRQRAKESERTLVSVKGDKDDAQRSLGSLQGVRSVELLGEKEGCPEFVLYSASGTSLWHEVNNLAKAKGWEIRTLAEKPLSLEETFLTLTQKAAKEGAAA